MTRRLFHRASAALTGIGLCLDLACGKELIYTNSFEDCPADIPANIHFWKGGALHNWTRETLRAVENQPPDGKKSLQVELRNGVVIHVCIGLSGDGGQPLILTPGKQYSFSISAKADKENAEVSLGCGWGQCQAFKIGKEWQRLVFRFTPKEPSAGLIVSCGPDARCWLDAVQVEEGEATPFDPTAKTVDPRCAPIKDCDGVQLPADMMEVPVTLVAKAPVIDGKLDDECWKDVPVHTIDSPKDGKKGATEFKIVSDGQFYYLAVSCHEPDMKTLLARQTERNSQVYTDDCLEIFLKGQLRLARYEHFMLNSIGTMAQEEPGGRLWGGGDWWDAKTSKEEDRWNAEIQLYVPFNYGASMPPDAPCLFNLCRSRVSAGEYLPWRGKYHRPDTFAALTGVVRPGPLLQELGFDYARSDAADDLTVTFRVRNISGNPLAADSALMMKCGGKEILIPGMNLDLAVGAATDVSFTLSPPSSAWELGPMGEAHQDGSPPPPAKGTLTVQLQAGHGKFRGEEIAIDAADMIRGPLLRHNVFAPEDKSAAFKLDLARLGGLLKEATVVLTVKDLFGKTLWEDKLPAEATLRGELPLTGLSPGDLLFEASALSGGKTVAAARRLFRLTEPGGKTELVRADFFRRALVRGKRPVTGLCGAYLFPTHQDDALMTATMDCLKKQGANVLYVSATPCGATNPLASPARMRTVLDKAAGARPHVHDWLAHPDGHGAGPGGHPGTTGDCRIPQEPSCLAGLRPERRGGADAARLYERRLAALPTA